MGLVTRRSDQLDKLFENFAIDPKKTPKKDKERPEKDNQKNDQQD